MIGTLLLLAAAAGASLWAWGRIPADALLPVHWNLTGQADRLGGKTEALITLPIGILVLGTLLSVLPHLMPDRHRQAGSTRGYTIVALGTLALLTGIHLVSVVNAVSAGVPVIRLVTAALAVFAVCIGVGLPSTSPNRLVGIRTPWTQADERTWARTHRFGGRLFVAAGVVLLPLAFVLPIPLLLPAALLAIIGPALATIIYSWLTRDATPRAG